MDTTRGRVAAGPLVVPAIAAAAAAMRFQFGPGISICLVVAILLAPVWLAVLREYRFARLLLALALIASAWGVVATQLDRARPWDVDLMIGQTSELMSLVGGAGMLLWARSAMGLPWTIAAFGGGALVNLALSGGNAENLWKFSLAVPVALIVLGISMHARNRILPIVLLAALAGVSALADSRSMTALLLLAATALLWQVSAPRLSERPHPVLTLLWIASAGFGLYLLLQALILDGALGEAAAQRSEAQIAASGSLLLGGRPELGAATTLIAARPLGYGSGTLPASSDVWLAKSGMAGLGYDPNNGYVERYMFGGHFEVHSVLGDLWVRFGPPGAAFVALIVAVGFIAAVSSLTARTASAALLFLTLLGAWDALFSPMLTSYRTLALLFAVAALPAAARALTGPLALHGPPRPSRHRSGRYRRTRSTPS
ncbi:MAG: hypothetical protein ACQEWM_07030 [Actinomycetota bacterium]